MAITVTVIGAGAFGGWTALHLLRAGCRVTLVDAWGPGHSRASSGDETRVIRGSYGPNEIYTQMVARAIPIWQESQRRWGVKLFQQNGALWMAGTPGNDSYEKSSLENIRRAGMPCEKISAAEGKRHWPQMNWDGIEWAVHETGAGHLFARRACQAVMEGFVAENGAYRTEAVDAAAVLRSPVSDRYVFACGPWLGQMFPDVLGKLITATRQEIFYFGTAAGDARFTEERFPTWVDNSPARYYGIPGNQWRGFKVAEDVAGTAFDPTNGDRRITESGLGRARAYLARRFPALKDAPLTESRVCQYEMSPDGDLIIDRLPGFEHVWIAGGGSGHGFKLGPAVGDMVAKQVLGQAPVEPRFALARFAGKRSGVGERK